MPDPIVHQIFGGTKADPKKKKAPPKVHNPYEQSNENLLGAFGDLGKGIAGSVKNNAKDAVGDAWKQLLGGDKLFHKAPQSGGDLHPGQELNLKAQQNQENAEKKPNIRAAMDYAGEILKAGEATSQKESQQTQQEIQQVVAELKNLAASAKALEKQVIEATGTNMVKPGKYHKNFFHFVLSIIRDAKAQIDNAGSWLSAMNGKQKKGAMGGGKKKTDYWSQAKKVGTTNFMLSGERSVSNQTA